ncbi:hypothetical protein PHYSODRAFT_316371 [Phytophthora sojae]|uniref:HTH CENPB-type domain-containing protein n=1 Tax=Phytophthora sojae (strain P6497) TaxID=1094619 RepID=G4ZSQ9_PHYSP|nr:hypothetical protein PHYSODRAFT_316371 [Phytophthora sojae]EGZ12780.1 hypothetical protein PHYSODRAFT_316371 [Phytophthora sojae]|eukprot:XP_009530209.1 hypothetical protein PHYSODRAFT_316371 [Phytophthora sojae]
MVRKWLASKAELEAAVALDAHRSGRQRKLGSGRRPNVAVDAALLQWVHARRESGQSVTDRLMKEQARVIAQEQGLTDFHASNGYIYSFKGRNKLLSAPTSSSSGSAGGSAKRRKAGAEPVTVQVSQEAAGVSSGPETAKRDCMFGIDIGLKNVKCALVCVTSGNILATSSVPIQHDASLLESEQSVASILLAVLAAVQALPTPLRQSIRSIGICGVMHGIVWWRCKTVRQAMCELLSARGGTGATSATSWLWSTYITFLDQRCSPSLLAEWRAKIQLANAAVDATSFSMEAVGGSASSSPIASGYGLATFAYMTERQPCDIEGFDTCGTIQDFIAFALCGHSAPSQNCMDVTDAFSWGGFDMNTKTWNPRTVQALGLPAHMLPTVKAPGAVIGQSSDVAAVIGLPHGKPVYLAMGDHPCAVMTTMAQTRSPADLNLSRTSVLSIGSASQLAMVLTAEDAAQLSGSCSLSFEVRPFLSENWFLGVAGSLSGGNIFAWFVKQCQAWSQQLAVDPTAEHLSDDELYARLISLGGTKLDTDLKFSPTLYGEWASPDVRGSIGQLRITNWSLGDISAAICRGLVDNIFSMVPEDLRADLLQQPQKLAHPSQLSIQSTADAAVGVAFIPSLLQK